MYEKKGKIENIKGPFVLDFEAKVYVLFYTFYFVSYLFFHK